MYRVAIHNEDKSHAHSSAFTWRGTFDDKDSAERALKERSDYVDGEGYKAVVQEFVVTKHDSEGQPTAAEWRNV